MNGGFQFVIRRSGRGGNSVNSRYYAGTHGWKDDKRDFHVLRFETRGETYTEMRQAERAHKLKPYTLDAAVIGHTI